MQDFHIKASLALFLLSVVILFADIVSVCVCVCVRGESVYSHSDRLPGH